ncbi:MAG: flavodoxin family protein [Bacteroidetes bacterium]|nr:flavodoxin family protein [Bacteroidota bacterium]
MQRVEFIIGSPRKRGNTAVLTEALNKQLDKEKFTSNYSFLYDFEIKACTDCRGCKRGNLTCIVEDDMQELYKRIDAANIIVFGTPIYWFTPTAKMKSLLDRLRPYYGGDKLANKKMAILLPAGVGEKDCDLTIEMFKRMARSLKLEFIEAVTSEAYDIGDAKKDEKAMIAITNLAKRF